MKQNKFIGHQILIRSIVMLLSLTLLFVSGIFSTDVKIEDTSFYSAEVVKNNTHSKKNISLIVREKEGSGPLPNWEYEFHGLYGSFRERTITFASTINADKTIDLRLGDSVSLVSECVSMLYFAAVGSVVYPSDNPTHFKHYKLPIELMFEDSKASYDVNRFIVNISQSQANKLLSNKGLEPQPDGNYLYEQYKSLIRTECNLIKGNSEVSKVCINNIYLEQNYYYEGLHETINEFVMVSYYLPWSLRDYQEHCYFLNDSAYQNSYFMKYINSVYGNDNYNISLNKNNLIGDVDEARILSFNTTIIASLNWLSILLLSFALFFIGLAIVSITILGDFKAKNIIFELVSLFIPYLLFFTIFKLTNNLFLFSSFSCLIYLFVVLAYISAFFFLMFFKRKKGMKMIKPREKSYEIHV